MDLEVAFHRLVVHEETIVMALESKYAKANPIWVTDGMANDDNFRFVRRKE